MFDQEMMQAMFAKARRAASRPLDTIFVPEHMIDEFYNRLIEMDDATEKAEDHDEGDEWRNLPGSIEAKRRFWGWLEDCIPALKGKDTRLNVSEPAKPRVEVMGEAKPPYLRKGMEREPFFHIDSSDILEHQLLQLVAEGERVSGVRETYANCKLWRFIHRVFPETATGSWSVVPTVTDGTYICKRLKDEEEDED
jgi:hypothetical protein